MAGFTGQDEQNSSYTSRITVQGWKTKPTCEPSSIKETSLEVYTLHIPQQRNLLSPQGLFNVTMYSWVQVSSDRSLIYGISDGQFFTKDASKAHKQHVDSVDCLGMNC